MATLHNIVQLVDYPDHGLGSRTANVVELLQLQGRLASCTFSVTSTIIVPEMPSAVFSKARGVEF